MREEIKGLIKDYDLDGIIILDQYEILEYFNIQKSYNLLEISPLLLITKNNEYLFLDRFTYEELKGLNQVKMILTDDLLQGSNKLTKKLKEIIKEEKIHKIGVFEKISIEGVKIIRIPNPFVKKFTFLDNNKADVLKECIDISNKVYNDLKNKIFIEETEIDMRNFIDSLIYKYGAEKRVYPTRVISGKRTSNPNSITEGFKIEYPLIIDYGIMKKNIGLGISRTFVQDEFKEILNKAVELETELINYIKPGRIYSKIYEYYFSVAEKMGLKDFIYGSISKPLLPYSKGIYINQHNEDIVQPGSYFHINIELYKPSEFGIKIIDVISVKDVAINLTEFY